MDIKRSNRNALATFVGMLLLFLLLGGGMLIYTQRQLLIQEAISDVDDQLQALSELATEALLRSDYESVERMVIAWAGIHPEVISARVTASNGFDLVNFTRDAGQPVFVRTRTVNWRGQPLVTIAIAKDKSHLEAKFLAMTFRFIAIALVFVSAMGWFLWRAIQRNALRPLQAEIARRELVEVELRRRGLDLEAANKELDAFCYSVSHDLRSPLRAIDGFSQVLREDYAGELDAQGQTILARICAATQRMGLLIDDLLRLSRLSTQALAPAAVDLSAMAREVADELVRHEPGRSVELSIMPGITAQGDPSLLRSVVENLLGNAWKYTAKHREAKIEFGVQQQNGEFVYFVRDNGVGFDMQYAGKLFGAFQRLHKPEDFPGAGIGLALVARIIRRHGGRIWPEAQPGHGATFYFTLA